MSTCSPGGSAIFHCESEIISRRRFNGGNNNVWNDIHGNMQLLRHSRHEQGRASATTEITDAFIDLPCEGTKSVRLGNPVNRTDIVVESD